MHTRGVQHMAHVKPGCSLPLPAQNMLILVQKWLPCIGNMIMLHFSYAWLLDGLRVRLTNDHLRVACSNLPPNIEQLAANMKCSVSH